MKTLLIFLMMVGTCYNALAAPFFEGNDEYTDYSQDADAVGVWRFNSDTADTAIDTSGSDNHLTLGGSPTYVTTGKEGNAWSFDSDGDAVGAVDIDAVDSATKLTVVAWVNLDAATSDDYVIENADNFSSGGFLFFRDESSAGSGRDDVWRVTLYDSTDATDIDIESNNGSAATTGTWIHLAFTADLGSATGLRLYVDSVEVDDSPVNISTVTAIDSGSGTWTIGTNSFSTFNRGFNGTIDEVSTFDRILSTAEILEIYTRGIK